MNKPILVAEIGCNHKGDMQTAYELIKMASMFCNVNYVKFQKRHNRCLLSPEQYESPHPNPAHSYGRTYGEHREYLEFSVEQHITLMDWCRQFGVGYSTSVWDVASAKEMATLEPDYLKIPSASNLHFEMLAYLCDFYGGKIHVSLGMTTREEEESIVRFFQDRNRGTDLVIYSCTSGYPVSFDEVCLLEIARLRQTYGSMVGAIGFSGHHLGIAVDVAAMTLGATWFERHYTLDRTSKGTDHAASLEPDGMRRLARDLHNVNIALTLKSKEILDVEEPQRTKLKWRSTNGDALGLKVG